MASEKRLNRINELIKRELGAILLREVEFPRQILVTITQAKTSQDLADCRVFISVFPQNEIKNILKILKANIWHIQQLLNKKLLIHQSPKITFCPDKELEIASNIDKILGSIKIEDDNLAA